MRTIAHRLLIVIVATFALATPASAAEVVRVKGAKLAVTERARTGFCVQLTTTAPAAGGGSGTCGQAPWRARRSMIVAAVSEDRVFVGGAVPASIARAEAELADGRRVAFDTAAGPGYRGRYAGRLRFFLAEVPLADPADDEHGGVTTLRFFDAGGALQGIAATEYLGRRLGAAKRLLRERGGGQSITVSATVRRRLVSTPLALDRFEDQPCIEVHRRESGFSSGFSILCTPPVPSPSGLAVYPESGCGRLLTVIAGFVGDEVSAVRLRLGSGRSLAVRTRTFAGARYVAARVPRGEAVRSVRAVGSSGGYELGEPPSGLPCVGSAGGIAELFFEGDVTPAPPLPPGSGEQVGAEAGRHRLLVRDGDSERLCAGVDALASDKSDCRVPPTVAEEAFVFASGGVVSAILPAEVARVRLPGGREVPVGEGGYDGRYQGAVRFLLTEADLAVGDRIRALDAGGAPIATLFVATSEPPPRVGRLARLASGHGWRLGAARFASIPRPCVALTVGGKAPECDLVADNSDGALATVSCTPRVAVLYGTLSRRTRSLRVDLRDGRTLRPRIVRLPRRLGGSRAFVLALPRGAEVKALRVDRIRATFPLLPASRQCGYRLYAPYLSG